jgi:hypothetical protein
MFKNLTCNFESICPEQFEDMPWYIRLTEFVEIELKPLATEAVVNKQLTALDEAEAQLRTQFQDKLAGLNERRQELRALTFQPSQS